MDMRELDACRHIASVSSADVCSLDVGHAPLALSAHDLATNACTWRNAIDLLRDERRCLAINLSLHAQTPGGPDQELSRALGVLAA